jgi:hypothetical protein
LSLGSEEEEEAEETDFLQGEEKGCMNAMIKRKVVKTSI